MSEAELKRLLWQALLMIEQLHHESKKFCDYVEVDMYDRIMKPSE